jgi:hypothetical protein
MCSEFSLGVYDMKKKFSVLIVNVSCNVGNYDVPIAFKGPGPLTSLDPKNPYSKC